MSEHTDMFIYVHNVVYRINVFFRIKIVFEYST